MHSRMITHANGAMGTICMESRMDDPISNFAPSASREKILDAAAGRSAFKRLQISSEGPSERRGAKPLKRRKWWMKNVSTTSMANLD